MPVNPNIKENMMIKKIFDCIALGLRPSGVCSVTPRKFSREVGVMVMSGHETTSESRL
jgi:hypothetical protein